MSKSFDRGLKILDKIKEEKEKEREECARVAENYDFGSTATTIAKRIRERNFVTPLA